MTGPGGVAGGQAPEGWGVVWGGGVGGPLLLLPCPRTRLGLGCLPRMGPGCPRPALQPNHPSPTADAGQQPRLCDQPVWPLGWAPCLHITRTLLEVCSAGGACGCAAAALASALGRTRRSCSRAPTLVHVRMYACMPPPLPPAPPPPPAPRPAAFVWEDGAYRPRTFNFYLFPRPVEGVDKRFVCQASPLHSCRRPLDFAPLFSLLRQSGAQLTAGCSARWGALRARAPLGAGCEPQGGQSLPMGAPPPHPPPPRAPHPLTHPPPPPSSTPPTTTLTPLQSSSMDFLARCGFDFNKAIYDGIGYMTGAPPSVCWASLPLSKRFKKKGS